MTDKPGLLLCKESLWHGRKAYVLSNHMVRVITLTGGGHIAAFHFEDAQRISPLWVPPWKTIEPSHYREKIHRELYGTIAEGKLLSGIVGHNICLDYFGSPSLEEAKQGLSQHGEAPSSDWHQSGGSITNRRISLELAVRLPIAGLRFSRKIELVKGESVVYFTETVRNERKADHFFHWTQHVSLGPPFLDPQHSTIALPGSNGITFPTGYDEGKALLASNEAFEWPHAPKVGGGEVDLTNTCLCDGLGFVAAVLLDKRRTVCFVAGVNPRMGLLIAYCFRRTDYPWVALWEENLGITAPPWKNRVRTRGLEFSTTPLPVFRRESFLSGRLFDEPTLACVPAKGKRVVSYVALLARVPEQFGKIRDIEVLPDQIRIQGEFGAPVFVQASRLNNLLS